MNSPPADASLARAPALETRRKRVRFRAWHRGTKEMDLIFGRFADAEAATLSEPELVEFERLMEEADDEVYTWVVGRNPTPAAFDTALFHRIRTFKPV